MKRTLLAAALVAVSATAFAADPQPSFNDNAPIQAEPARQATVVKGDLPKPSFNDNAAIADSGETNTRGSDSAVANVPAPSFAG